MSIVRVQHATTYRYRRPVSIGAHRLMLRPRDSHDLRLISAELVCSPPAMLTWSHDVFGNSIAHAAFAASVVEQTSPISGAFIGAPDDFLGLDVTASVTPN